MEVASSLHVPAAFPPEKRTLPSHGIRRQGETQRSACFGYQKGKFLLKKLIHSKEEQSLKYVEFEAFAVVYFKYCQLLE